MRFVSAVFGLAFVAAVWPANAFAQDATVIPPAATAERLQSLYFQSEANPDNEYLQKLIDNEIGDLTLRIKERIDALTQSTVEDSLRDNENIKTTPVERQRGVVSRISEMLGEVKADLDLLRTEEKTFYTATGSAVSATGAVTGITKTTQNYQQLAATKKLLELRIAALESALRLQEARLSKLQQQQFFDQFSVVINLGKYILFIILVTFIERQIRKRLLSKISDDNNRYRITKTFTTVWYGIVIVWVVAVTVASNPGVLASVAIIGAGLAIAMQDIVKDIVAWGIIAQNRLFTRGDRITIGSICGEVVDFNPMRTTMLEVGIPVNGEMPSDALERTGKLISIPNAQFLVSSLTNHSATSNYVRSEIKVCITFESDFEKAVGILEKILEEHTAQYASADANQTRGRTRNLYYIPHRTAGNQVYTSIAADGVEFTLRFTVPIGEKRPIVSRISTDILRAFNKEKSIDLAYTTIRYYKTKGDFA